MLFVHKTVLVYKTSVCYDKTFACLSARVKIDFSLIPRDPRSFGIEFFFIIDRLALDFMSDIQK